MGALPQSNESSNCGKTRLLRKLLTPVYPLRQDQDNDMAKFGEGDARWIVEDRADGANVNNWHWTEKDVMKPAEDRLTQMVTSHEGPADCSFTGVEKFAGFIQLCNRKGVVKVQYTLEVELKFKREVAGEDCTGVVKMDEVFDDEPEAEVVIDRKCKGKTAEPDRALKEKLCADAVQLVTGMIENMKNTAGKMMSPQSQNK